MLWGQGRALVSLTFGGFALWILTPHVFGGTASFEFHTGKGHNVAVFQQILQPIYSCFKNVHLRRMFGNSSRFSQKVLAMRFVMRFFVLHSVHQH